MLLSRYVFQSVLGQNKIYYINKQNIVYNKYNTACKPLVSPMPKNMRMLLIAIVMT